MKENISICESGTKKSQTITSKTVYGKFIFFDKIYVKVEIVRRTKSDKLELKKLISIF